MSWRRFFAEMVTYTPSHFQILPVDLGWLGAFSILQISPNVSKFLQYHHHPSKKPPRNLEVSARIPLVICLWTASEVTQMLTFDAWTSDWRWFPQYPPILCFMSRVCLARCFKSIFYILYAKHVFFSIFGAFRCFASCFHSTSPALGQGWAAGFKRRGHAAGGAHPWRPSKTHGNLWHGGRGRGASARFFQNFEVCDPEKAMPDTIIQYIHTDTQTYIYIYMYICICIIYISQYIDLS